MRETWRAENRAAVTFSLPTSAARDRAARAAMAAVDSVGGYTYRPGTGGWRGAREPAGTLEIVGDRGTVTAAIGAAVPALHAAGCEAVQVESWSRSAYAVREYRP
jgi:hypothetical protein